ATPLALRPSHPLNLAPEPGSNHTSWTVLLVFAVAAGGLWYAKRHLPQGQAPAEGGLKILHRASIGVRSELLVVEACGQRLLLGVTPSAVQHLAALDAPEGPSALAAPEEPPESVSARFEHMLTAAARKGPALVRDTERARAPSEAPRETPREAPSRASRASRRAAQEPVEEQARGLLALGERP
ncbi:MAG: flagellar biosynthetic protein FliO, partial [Deltaproteobacteria bacterium]|nr:flagellar biosynthetic protein FliO [Deltaproteobacteria bacterium]